MGSPARSLTPLIFQSGSPRSKQQPLILPYERNLGTAPKEEGEDCDTHSDCESTLFCKKQCKKKKGEGRSCRTNENCLSGLCGETEKCVTDAKPTQLPTATQTGGKEKGDKCDTHSECLATLYCKKKCKNKKKEGKNCKGINEYCLSELCGEAKTCVTTAKPTQLPTTTQTGGKKVGDDCNSPSDCESTLYCKKQCKNKKKEGKNCKGINEQCLSELCGDTQTCVTDANPTQLPTTTPTGGKKKVGDDCNSPSDCEST